MTDAKKRFDEMSKALDEDAALDRELDTTIVWNATGIYNLIEQINRAMLERQIDPETANRKFKELRALLAKHGGKR